MITALTAPVEDYHRGGLPVDLKLEKLCAAPSDFPLFQSLPGAGEVYASQPLAVMDGSYETAHLSRIARSWSAAASRPGSSGATKIDWPEWIDTFPSNLTTIATLTGVQIDWK